MIPVVYRRDCSSPRQHYHPRSRQPQPLEDPRSLIAQSHHSPYLASQSRCVLSRLQPGQVASAVGKDLSSSICLRQHAHRQVCRPLVQARALVLYRKRHVSPILKMTLHHPHLAPIPLAIHPSPVAPDLLLGHQPRYKERNAELLDLYHRDRSRTLPILHLKQPAVYSGPRRSQFLLLGHPKELQRPHPRPHRLLMKCRIGLSHQQRSRSSPHSRNSAPAQN